MSRASQPALVPPVASAGALSAAARSLAATLAALHTLIAPLTSFPLADYELRSPTAASLTLPRGASLAHERRRASTTAHPLSLSRPRAGIRTPEQRERERARRAVLQEAWDVLRERYVDKRSIDWERLKRRVDARVLETDEQLQHTLEGLFTRAEDPFTRYIPAEQLGAMKDDIDGEMCGVGIVFRAERRGWWRGRRVIVKHVVNNSPAEEAGLQKGDQIMAIDMVGVGCMSFEEATMRLLGKEGHRVLISFRRSMMSDNVQFSAFIKRRRFAVPSVSSELVNVPGVGAVGYLQVREFAANTTYQMRAAVRQLVAQNACLFVLDMRGNSGGLVNKAVEVAKVFLARDRIVVRFVGSDGETTMERSGWRFFLRPRVHVTREPIVVLVDGETASASELVAAALRDNCRAVLVGDTTFGKGSVQAIVPLSDGAGVAVSVARYRTPRDRGLEVGRGLRPDWFRSGMADDGDAAVRELFGKRPERRYRWVVGRLEKCVAPHCGKGGNEGHRQAEESKEKRTGKRAKEGAGRKAEGRGLKIDGTDLEGAQRKLSRLLRRPRGLR